MAVYCRLPGSSCPRCHKPLEVGEQIQPLQGESRRRWVHVGCRVTNENRSERQPEPHRNGDDCNITEEIRKIAEQAEPATVPVERPEPSSNGKASVDVARLEQLIKDGDEKVLDVMGKALNRVGARAEQAVTAEAGRITREATAALVEQIDARVAEAVKALPLIRTIEVRVNGEVTRRLDGEVYLPQIDRIVRLAAARKNVMLISPSGAGKSYAAEQVARLLGLRFASMSLSGGVSEGVMKGRLLPVGEAGRFEYVMSVFIDLFESGGLLLLDEIDAADENVLLVINSALANGWCDVPSRPAAPRAVRHPDFVCVAAANTWGTGADRQYCGRNQLDEATLDRFRVGMVEIDYCEAIERACCPDKALYKTFTGWRTKIRANGLERVLSTRFIRDAYDMLQVGDTMADIETAFFGGWRPEEVTKVLGRPAGQSE